MPRSLAGGFSLLELALVLLAVSLLAGGLLIPLGTQLEQSRLRAAGTQARAALEALHGFVLLHRRLPCPAAAREPRAADYGLEDCSTPDAEGLLPWRSLGLPENDPWGSPRLHAAQDWRGYWRYRAAPSFSAAPFDLDTRVSGGAAALVVVDATGRRLTSVAWAPLAVLFCAGPNGLPDGENRDLGRSDAIYQAQGTLPEANFDDLLYWISHPLLVGRLAAAGRLP